MIRRHRPLFRLALAVADAVAAATLVTLISEFRFGQDWPVTWRALFSDAWVPATLLAGGWITILWSQGLYGLRQRWSFRGHIVAMGRALALMIVLTFAALFLFKLEDVSRAFLLVALPSLALASLALRGGIYGILDVLHRHGQGTRNLLIVGSGSSAVRFADNLAGHPTLGLKIIGYVNGEPDEPGMSWPYLGPTEKLADVLHQHVIDEIAVCLDLAAWETIQQIVELARAEGKIVRLPLAGGILAHGNAEIETLSGVPILSLVQGPDRQLALAAKRVLDVAVASGALLISLPLALLVALAVLREDGRPVLFRQERVGLHGRRFSLVKFRTMRHGAEQMLPDLLPRNEVNGHAFKVTNDPRVTRIGRLLRRTSLDEIPQLWNVLRGEMSIVGPRPPLPAEVQYYDAWHRRRLSMKPGITGLWQVSARREADFDRWVEKDLEYIDGWSLWLDTKIALMTVPAIFRMEGR
jgi:exopolysaccharide biosynthesis polyprenyl glycosylphosphotransferase